MLKKLVIVFILGVLLLSCTSIPVWVPQLTPTMISPTATSLPTVTVEDLLARQVNNDLSAYPRPACEAGKRNEPEWNRYGQGLAAALRRLFSDDRSQSFSSQSLASVFKKGSGVSLDTYESNTDAVLASILNANCPQQIGGGASPYSPRDTVYVLNRHGGMWQIAQVANALKAVWAEDRWITLVTKTEYGGGSDFEIWHVRSIVGEWKNESKFQFTQSASQPLPRLSSAGSTVTLYSLPAACNLPKSSPDSYPIVESDYQWQNGQYRCVASRIIPTPVPTRRP